MPSPFAEVLDLLRGTFESLEIERGSERAKLLSPDNKCCREAALASSSGLRTHHAPRHRHMRGTLGLPA